jgi:CRP/FNR family transcriptional regulator, dissimilatory nitrate respiration regulator
MDWNAIRRSTPLLGALNAAAFVALTERAVARRFAAGEVLWSAGSEPRGLCIVVSGEVRVVRATAGRQYVVHTEGPGGTLGEVPLFSGGRFPATAIASLPTTCLVLSRDLLAQLITLDPEFAFRLLGSLAARVRTLVSRLDRVTGRSVQCRLAGHLIYRYTEANGDVITLGDTQLRVAEELGTVREVLVRSLARLRHAGVIASAGRGRYRVLNEAALRQAADAG